MRLVSTEPPLDAGLEQLYALSEGEVLFEEFGRLFRDCLRCGNALFLDGGNEPSLYVPGVAAGNTLLGLGPMIGVFEQTKR